MKKTKLLFPLVLFLLSFMSLNGQMNIRNLDIVYIGNSITQGVQLDNQDEVAPPAFATKHIRTLQGVESARFLNRGKSGYTTVNFLPTPDGELSKAIIAVKEFHTDQNRQLVFSIMLGTNDRAE
jgi:lysophospholipase L1-like esterase